MTQNIPSSAGAVQVAPPGMAATPPPRRRNQRGEGGLLKGEVIRAAMRILDRAPATELSLRMVAKEAGIAAPSIYPHFKDVKTLMTEIVRDCWRQLGGAMSQAAAGAGADPYDALKAQMAAYVRYAMERPSRYQLLFALPQLEMEVLRELPGTVQPAYRNVMESLERYAASGRRLPWDDIADMTLFVLSLAHGRIALAQTAPHRAGNEPAGVESFVLDILERVFRG